MTQPARSYSAAEAAGQAGATTRSETWNTTGTIATRRAHREEPTRNSATLMDMTRERKPGSAPSIDQVAEAAGVHKSTVSRAFSRPESVRTRTRDHVLAVAAEMGYSMSPLARALRTKTSTLVPLIVPDITNPFFGELAKSMTAAAESHGYHLVLCVAGDDKQAIFGYLHAMQAMYAPFAILAPFSSIDPTELEPLGFENRLVIMDRVDSHHSVSTVTVDSGAGIRQAFEHLVGLGHTNIAYVSGIVGTHTAADRRAAYDALSTEHHMQPAHFEGGVGAEAGRHAAAQMLSSHQQPTAVIAANDMVAMGLISELGEAGVRVPHDISIVGFDGLQLGARTNPPLTSVAQPITEMGEAAIELAQGTIANGETKQIVLQPSLLVRASTSHPKR